MISEAAKLYKELQTIPDDEVPIIIPVFNLVSYTKFMVEQLKNIGLNNFIICDNNSSYPPMIKYLKDLSKTDRVVFFNENLGPRVYGERPEFLSVLPEYFIITDPDIIFNKSLPKNFLNKMKRIINMYNVSKVGFAIDIENTKNKFFNSDQVNIWEGNYWKIPITLYDEQDSLYSAPIDTTFCLYKKDLLIKELLNNRSGLPSTTSIRIAGRFTCEHMGWWKEQPLSIEEELYYNDSQQWASTYKEKKRLGYV